MNEEEGKFLDWLKTDQPRVGDHEYLKIREGLLKTWTLREAFLSGANSQRHMTANVFNIKLELKALEARQALAKAGGK